MHSGSPALSQPRVTSFMAVVTALRCETLWRATPQLEPKANRMKHGLIGAALIVGLLSGCGPAWKVVRVSGPPSALAGATDVALSFDYTQMYVEGRKEADWVAAKTAEDAKYTETWADLKGRFEAAVLQGLRTEYPQAHPPTGNPSEVVMTVQVRSFKLGKFIPFVLPPTVMDSEIIFAVNGQAGDEISLVRSYPASLVQPSVFNHIGSVGQQIGAAGGKLIASKKNQ